MEVFLHLMPAMIFYKGVLQSDLVNPYIPGSITRDIQEALQWQNRIVGKSKKGAGKHIRHGHAVIIEINLDTAMLQEESAFQKCGCHEHQKANCWLAKDRMKAQINTPVSYRVLELPKIDQRLSQYNKLKLIREGFKKENHSLTSISENGISNF